MGTRILPLAVSCRHTFLEHLPGGAFVTLPYIGTFTPPLAVFQRHTQLIHFPEAPPCPLPCLPTWARAYYLWSSPVGTPSLSISREEPLLCFPTSACPRRLGPSRAGTPSWRLSLKGALPRLHTSASPRCLWPSPNGASSWCIPREYPCHVSLHRPAHAASYCLLPVHQVSASVGSSTCPLPCFPTWARAYRFRPSPAGTPSWSIYLEDPSTPRFIVTPTPTFNVCYRRT